MQGSLLLGSTQSTSRGQGHMHRHCHTHMGVLRCRNVSQSTEVHLEELAKGFTDGKI